MSNLDVILMLGVVNLKREDTENCDKVPLSQD